MPTQAERETQFIWRPNDNSVTTRTRYDLEAEHWYRSFKAAERKHRPTSFKSDLAVIGLLVSLVASLLVLVIVLIIDFIKWVRS